MHNSILLQPIPVTEGQEINATMDHISSGDDKITRIQNFPIFMSQTKNGEHLNAKNVKVTEKIAIAEENQAKRGGKK